MDCKQNIAFPYFSFVILVPSSNVVSLCPHTVISLYSKQPGISVEFGFIFPFAVIVRCMVRLHSNQSPCRTMKAMLNSNCRTDNFFYLNNPATCLVSYDANVGSC